MAAVGKVNRGKQRCLNEVRPGRPEQYVVRVALYTPAPGLNEVRPGRPKQLSRPCPCSAPARSLNEVRPGRPEQWSGAEFWWSPGQVSQ